MIKKTLIATVVLILVYNLLIVYVVPHFLISQHQQQENVIQAQTYIFSDTGLDKVIVGSSLSRRLSADSLKQFYNLAFNAHSIFDGLKIIVKKKQLPHMVFIETNMLLKEEDRDFIAALYQPILFYMRKYLISLRDGRQPLAYASIPFAKATDRTVHIIKGQPLTGKDQQPAPLKRIPKELYSKIMAGRIEANSAVPDKKNLSDAIALLRHYVNVLEANHVQVVFFEMPVDAALCNLATPSAVRAAILRSFPATRYRYIPQPDCSTYTTEDGLHMGAEEAARYAVYFKGKAL